MRMTFFSTIFRFCCVLVCFGFLAPSPAAGQPQTSTINNQVFSVNELVGFGFHRLAKIEPNFQQWVQRMPAYMNAPPMEKQNIMSNELHRLQNGFFQYRAEDHPIRIRLDGNILASNTFPQSQMDGTVTTVQLSLDGLPGAHIPVQVGNLWVAIIVEDIERFMEMRMNRREYNDFARQSALRSTSNRNADVVIDLVLRPVFVDTTQSMRIDGLEMWPMLMEIGNFTMWHKHRSREMHEMYVFNAPWFVSSAEQNLFDIYRNR